MPANRALQFFLVTMIAFVGIMIASALQLLVQWQHASDAGWVAQIAAARAGNVAVVATLVVSGMLGLAMTISSVVMFRRRRYLVGAAVALWAVVLLALPEVPFAWVVGVASVTGLVTLTLIISLIAARGKSANAAPAKKAS